MKVETELSITISGGVAQAVEGDTQETLLARADSAMYEAKAAGRNGVFFHDGERLSTVQIAEAAPTVELVVEEAAAREGLVLKQQRTLQTVRAASLPLAHRLLARRATSRHKGFHGISSGSDAWT